MKAINGLERRTPRDTFTKKLVKMCKRLDELSQETITWKGWFFDDSRSSQITIEKLWVVGSYARGSLSCGDLDLVFSYKNIGEFLPEPKDIARGFFGSLRETSFYSGTPEVNSSGVAFEGAVEIWSGHGCDWQKALQSIIPDPSAGRAPRLTDVIPIRIAQLGSGLACAEKTAQMIQDGVLESEFIPFSLEMLEPLNDERLLSLTSNWRYSGFGKETKKLLPAIARTILDKEPTDNWEIEDGKSFSLGGTKINVGRSLIPSLSEFDSLSLRQMVIIPNLSERGPNGAWFLRRGNNHQVVKAFANKKAFVLATHGVPDLQVEINGSIQTFGVELFTTLSGAEDNLNDCIEVMLIEDPESASIKEVSGDDLHNLISGLDLVRIDGSDYASSCLGSENLEQPKANISEIILALPDMISKNERHPEKRISADDAMEAAPSY